MMAALLKHGFAMARPAALQHVQLNGYVTKPRTRSNIDRKVPPKIDSSMESLAAKGFLRPQKAYSPPEDVDKRVKSIFHQLTNTQPQLSTKIHDLNLKYPLFSACCDEFQHDIPNSLLHTITTVAELIEFFATPVNTITPYDNLKNLDLPPNMHVQYEYHRFDPKTDTKFGGVTAFPRSSTIVSGLKYKDKYKGHEEPELEEWPFLSKFTKK